MHFNHILQRGRAETPSGQNQLLLLAQQFSAEPFHAALTKHYFC